MQIESRPSGSVMTVVMKGRLDSVTSPDVIERLTGFIDGGMPRLAIDLREIAYISSAGFRALLVASRSAQRAGGGVALSGVLGEVRRLFEIAAFTELFAICDSLEAAANALMQPSGSTNDIAP